MSNSPATVERLVEECQGLVRFLARQIHTRMSSRLDLDDLVGYGQLGLMMAAQDYDPDKGTKFSTFAYYRIRGAIYDGVNKLQWFKAVRNSEIKTGPLVDALLQDAASDDSDSGSGSKSLESEANWFGKVASSLAVLYLVSADDESRPAEVEDKSAAEPWDGMAQGETSTKLREAVSKLPADAAALVQAVYFEDRTLQEAADQLGISKSWASRLHSRALDQLARHLRDTAL